VVAEALEDTADESAAAMTHHPGTALSPLTPREREVAELVARGVHRDRDIAKALTIAKTTAGLHVRRILAKLGLHSRWEIAAWVNRNERAREIPASADGGDALHDRALPD
jgi:DNA-binding NarL/FixJ family response regulator